MTEIEIKLASLNGKVKEAYGKRVNELIRERYTFYDEMAIIRQRDEKPEEFAAYNAFAEECKAVAKIEIYGESADA